MTYVQAFLARETLAWMLRLLAVPVAVPVGPHKRTQGEQEAELWPRAECALTWRTTGLWACGSA